MRDHQRFERETLPNDITLYTYKDSFRTLNLEILFPIGAAHSHAGNGFLPGSAHFLEHVQMIRSSRYPEAYALDRTIGLLGGHGDGTTYPSWTSHWIDAPASQSAVATAAFVDRVFHPLFEEEDFETERTVIMNERNQRTFYPGKTPGTKHYYTQFLSDIPYPLEQMFGSDDDLAAMTVERIREMHAAVTADKGMVAIAVGPDDFDDLRARLSEIPTNGSHVEPRMAPTTWANPRYSTAYFDTVAQPTLKVAWLHDRLPYEEAEGLGFILSLLINTTHGPLYEEFREERGWVYGLDGFCSQREANTIFGLTFPVNEAPQVQFIRECLHERIVEAVTDQSVVEREIMRCLNNQVYSYQTSSEIIGSASQDIMAYGTVHSEREWAETLRRMADPAWRQSLLDRYFRPEDMGEVCYMPERRTLVPKRDLAAETSFATRP